MWPYFQPVEVGIFVSCMIRSNIFWNLLKPSEITSFWYYPLSENLCCVDTKSILLITTSPRNSGSIEGRKNYCWLIKGQLFHIFFGSPRGFKRVGGSGFYVNEAITTKQYHWPWWEATTNQIGHRKFQPIRLQLYMGSKSAQKWGKLVIVREHFNGSDCEGTQWGAMGTGYWRG